MDKAKKPYDREKVKNSNVALSDISLLYKKFPLATYTVVSRSGPIHEPNFIAECRVDDKNVFYGEGKSKQKAKQDAASNALKFIASSNTNGEQKDSESTMKSPTSMITTPPKAENNVDRIHVGIVLQNLHPNLNFIWTKGNESNTHVGEVVVNGKTYKDESVSKKITKVKLASTILKELYNLNSINMPDGSAYIEGNDWKKLRSKKQHHPLQHQKTKVSKIDQPIPFPPVCGQKHPIQFLYEIYTTLDYKETNSVNLEDGHPSKCCYTLDLENATFTGEASTRKIAKLNCAINAINGLLEMGILQQRLEIKEMNKDMIRKHKMAKKEKYLMKQDTRLKYQGEGMKKFKFVDFKKSETLHANHGITSPANYPGHHHLGHGQLNNNNFFNMHTNEQPSSSSSSYSMRLPQPFMKVENQNANLFNQQQPFVKSEFNQTAFVKSEFNQHPYFKNNDYNAHQSNLSAAYAVNSNNNNYNNNERSVHHHQQQHQPHHHHHQQQPQPQQQQYHYNSQTAHETVYGNYSGYNNNNVTVAGSGLSNRIPFNY